MKKQLSVSKQVLVGVFATAVLWLFCVLISGVTGVGDIMEITPGVPGVRGILPLFVIAYFSLVSFFAKKYKNKQLFYSCFITLGLPIIGFWLMKVGGAFALFSVFALPVTSVYYGFIDTFGQKTVFDVLMLCVFACGTAVYMLVKPEKE